MSKTQGTSGWGVVDESGSEIWDAKPIFTARPGVLQKAKLIFYPKRFVLFGAISKEVRKLRGKRPLRILDLGCGTGAAMIDMKRLWGDRVEVAGLDVVKIQVEMASQRFRDEQVDVFIEHYDGVNIPSDDNYFDVVYTSDVLGHVEDVDAWLKDIARVTRPGGLLAMFSESTLGKHAWLRKRLLSGGVNTDPHAEFHISLFDKATIRKKIEQSFDIKKMFATVWLKFLVHPDELYPTLQKQDKFPITKKLNEWLYTLKKKTHPYSTAIAEFYSLIEMLTIGRWVESQGYVIVARKKANKK